MISRETSEKRIPAWFMDIESATEIEAKSNGVPPAARIESQASRANSPSSALQGVTRPSVDATPTKGLAISSSLRPRPCRNARCGARSSPSTVTREGRIGMVFFVFTDDFRDVAVSLEAEFFGALRVGPARRRVHERLDARIRVERHLPPRPAADRFPHLPGSHRDPGQEE